ncbi:hypothetical protein [Actinoplanes sp. NPDC051411]|uniref:hypothetical protein n=1 Tax=Actinoplanes sp. NPDC051411 TaxID=3155522 RepID=UPI0034455F64
MTVPNPAHNRAYPMPAPADDRRFSLGLVFAVAQVLVDHGFPPITAGGDLVALQQALYGFLYAPPDDGGFAERFLARQQEARRAALLADERGREGYAEGYVDCVVASRPERAERSDQQLSDEVGDMLTGGPAPAWLDPETAETLGSLVRRLHTA